MFRHMALYHRNGSNNGSRLVLALVWFENQLFFHSSRDTSLRQLVSMLAPLVPAPGAGHDAATLSLQHPLLVCLPLQVIRHMDVIFPIPALFHWFLGSCKVKATHPSHHLGQIFDPRQPPSPSPLTGAPRW